MCEWIHRWSWLLYDFARQPWLPLQYLACLVDAVNWVVDLQGMLNVQGFLMGLWKPAAFYSGHKRTHSCNYQAAVAANGLVVHLHEPVEASRHNAAHKRSSDFIWYLRQCMPVPAGGGVFQVYCDKFNHFLPLQSHQPQPRACSPVESLALQQWRAKIFILCRRDSHLWTPQMPRTISLMIPKFATP